MTELEKIRAEIAAIDRQIAKLQKRREAAVKAELELTPSVFELMASKKVEPPVDDGLVDLDQNDPRWKSATEAAERARK